MGLKTQRVLLL